jgi:hypothetical protein
VVLIVQTFENILLLKITGSYADYQDSLVTTAQVHAAQHVGVIDDRELKSTEAGWHLFAFCLNQVS